MSDKPDVPEKIVYEYEPYPPDWTSYVVVDPPPPKKKRGKKKPK
jgi:hypothetical protein